MTFQTNWIIFTLLCLSPHLLAFNEEFYKEQEGPSPTQLPTVKLPPCQKPKGVPPNQGKSDVIMSSSKFKGVGNDILEKENYENIPVANCTEDGADDDGTSSEPIMYDHWKLHIIMACTVTAAVEFLLIIFIILYWRQIRWTLRKITCPCDRYRNRTHEAMEVEDEDRNEFDLENGESNSQPRSGGSHQCPSIEHTRVQRYSAPRNSRVQSASGSYSLSEDLAVPGPSGLSQKSSSPSSFSVIVHKYSSSDESLSDLEGRPSGIQVSPSTRNQNKSTKGKAAQGKSSSTHKVKPDVPAPNSLVGSDLLGAYKTQTANAHDPLGACHMGKITGLYHSNKSDTDLNSDLSHKGTPQTLTGAGGERSAYVNGGNAGRS